MADIYELIKDYVVTLNGITADVFEYGGHILIHNRHFKDIEEEADEVIVPRKAFLQQLKQNNGRFES